MRRYARCVFDIQVKKRMLTNLREGASALTPINTTIQASHLAGLFHFRTQ